MQQVFRFAKNQFNKPKNLRFITIKFYFKNNKTPVLTYLGFWRTSLFTSAKITLVFIINNRIQPDLTSNEMKRKRLSRITFFLSIGYMLNIGLY